MGYNRVYASPRSWHKNGIKDAKSSHFAAIRTLTAAVIIEVLDEIYPPSAAKRAR
jgi:hypothetical protein